jgi:hypothetical protein
MAVKALVDSSLTHVERINLATDCDIPGWLFSSYVALCARPEPLSVDEGRLLGLERTVTLAQAREEVRAAYSGPPLLDHVADIVADLFALERPEGSIDNFARPFTPGVAHPSPSRPITPLHRRALTHELLTPPRSAQRPLPAPPSPFRRQASRTSSVSRSTAFLTTGSLSDFDQHEHHNGVRSPPPNYTESERGREIHADVPVARSPWRWSPPPVPRVPSAYIRPLNITPRTAIAPAAYHDPEASALPAQGEDEVRTNRNEPQPSDTPPGPQRANSTARRHATLSF